MKPTYEELEQALAQLKADRHHVMVRSAGRLAMCAWVMMLIMAVFAGVLIVSSALRVGRSCPVAAEKAPP